jgi:hypothetical protein
MKTIISGANWGATHMHLFGLGLRTICLYQSFKSPIQIPRTVFSEV